MAAEPPRPAGHGELRTRILSAAILAPVALAAVAAGGVLFALLVALVAAIGYWEWTSIAAGGEPRWIRFVCLAVLVMSLLALSLDADARSLVVTGPALAAIVAAALLPRLRWTLSGFVYVIVPCAAFIVLRRAEASGWAAILFVLVVVWATDIAAFFGGRAIGGARLWPRVSPKKTWSGAICGLVAATAAGGLAVWSTGIGDISAGLLLAVPLSIAAQAGDLLESAVKRRFGAKDSGTIIPGHGGVLDRVDGLFGAAAASWLLAALGLGGGVLSLPAQGAATVGAMA